MRRHAERGFTVIELLMVIAIIMVVAAATLPYFVAMQKSRKWTTATSNIQSMIWRARALATNVRKDFAVEFNCQGNAGTRIWVAAKSNLIERLPDLDGLQHQLGGASAVKDIVTGDWTASGGNYGGLVTDGVNTTLYYSNLTFNPANSKPALYGHNSVQTEVILVHPDLTVDDSSTYSPYFVNLDQNCLYGSDATKDIRVGPNGALVQTLDPTICIREIANKTTDQAERIRVQVVRCTGRLKQLPR